MSIIQLYLFGILHEAEFILRHLSGIINKTISKVAIVKGLYHALKLRVYSDKEACGRRGPNGPFIAQPMRVPAA